MLIQRTLLERLRKPDPAGTRSLHVASTEVFDSILENLQAILNTTQGNCLTDASYGLPHLTTVRSAMPHSIGGYEAAIRTAIQRFEPRLSNVRVRHAPGSESRFELRFEISGLIVDEEARTSVRFETYAGENGRMEIR
jgi:type VI secretion system protein